MPATDNTIRVRVNLDAGPFKKEAQAAKKEFEKITREMGISIQKLNELRSRYNTTVERARQSFEQKEIAHQQRLELIQERSAKQVLAIEQRKLASQELMRER